MYYDYGGVRVVTAIAAVTYNYTLNRSNFIVTKRPEA
jgi:hypothetical protein